MKTFQTFSSPYILVEDLRSKHAPFFSQFPSSFPALNLQSKAFSCPFAEHCRFVSRKKDKVRVGYCEVCFVRFSDYEKHVGLPLHRDFATNVLNYQALDLLISEINNDPCESDSSNSGRPASPCLKLSTSIEMRSVGVSSVDHGKCFADTLVFSRLSNASSDLSDYEKIHSVKASEIVERIVAPKRKSTTRKYTKRR